MSDTKQPVTSETQVDTLVTHQEAIDKERMINCEAIARQYLEPIYKEHYIDTERDTAATNILKLMTQILMDQAEEHDNTEYYRGIVVKIGELFGPAAYQSDDGSWQEDVLCAKVFDLVNDFFKENQMVMDKNAELQEALNKVLLNTKTSASDSVDKNITGIPDAPSLGISSEAKDETTQFINEALMKQVAKLQKENNELKKAKQSTDDRGHYIFTVLTQGLSFQQDLLRYAGNPNNFDAIFVILNSVLRKYDAIKAVVNEQNNPTPYFTGVTASPLKPPYHPFSPPPPNWQQPHFQHQYQGNEAGYWVGVGGQYREAK